MHDLPTWEIVIVGAVVGFLFLFLLCFLLILLLSWWTGVSEPPTLILFLAGKISRYFRHRQFRRGPGPAPEPVNTDPLAASPASSPPTKSDQLAG